MSKTKDKNLKFSEKNSRKNNSFFANLFSNSRNRGECTKLVPETKSRNSGDHEF